MKKEKIEFEKVVFEDEVIAKDIMIDKPIAFISTRMIRRFPVHRDEFKKGQKVKITIKRCN